jgi:ComF family protein
LIDKCISTSSVHRVLIRLCKIDVMHLRELFRLEVLTELLFPRLCMACEAHLRHFENGICLICAESLPLSYHWRYPVTPIERLFAGRVPIARGCTYLDFSKGGKVQHMMHSLKYQGRQDVGVLLGARFGSLLIEEGFFEPVDLIVPVPLHRARQDRRGYNQSELIAEGMAGPLGAPLATDVLLRAVATESQTSKGRYERAVNMDGVFKCPKPKSIKEKHILLVDDVITTGSTLGACVHALLDHGAAKVSVAGLAHAVS